MKDEAAINWKYVFHELFKRIFVKLVFLSSTNLFDKYQRNVYDST